MELSQKKSRLGLRRRPYDEEHGMVHEQTALLGGDARRSRRFEPFAETQIDEIGEAAREQAERHVSRLQQQEKEVKRELRKSRLERPTSVYEADTDRIRRAEPLPERSHQPVTPAAELLRNQRYVSDELETNPSSYGAAVLMQRRAELLKDSDFSMSEKREISKAEKRNARALESTLDTPSKVLFQSTKTWNRLAQNIPRTDSLGAWIWHTTLRRIEGHFGSAVASYYRLLIWLISLNLTLSILIVCFVAVPQQLAGVTQRSSFQASNLLFGNGYFAESILFIGNYKPERPNGYDVPLAYFLTLFAFLLASVYALVHNMANRFADSSSLSSRSALLSYSVAVLAGWDHTINSPVAQKNKRKGVTRALCEMLEEDKAAQSWTYSQAIFWATVRICTNLIVFAILGGAIYAIDLLTRTYTSSESAWRAAYPALALTGFNSLLPALFYRISLFENWSSPRINVQLTLARSYLLRMAGVYVIVISLFGDESKVVGDSQCWENSVGRELYKLIVIDTLVSLVTTVVYDALRRLMHKYGQACCPTLSRALGAAPEFPLASSLLSLVYRQALVWLGAFYSPLLPLVTAVCDIVILYVKKGSMNLFLEPPTRVFRASRSDNFYFGMLLATLFIAIAPVTYSLLDIEHSGTCGPFRDLRTIYAVLPSRLASLPRGVRQAAFYLGSGGFLLPFFLLLIILLYYFVIVSRARHTTLRHLEVRLLKDRQEKKELIQHYKRDSIASLDSLAPMASHPTGSLRPPVTTPL